MLATIDRSIVEHHHAADLAEQARDLLAAAASGTLQTDAEQACALFTRAIEGITEPEGQLSGLATAAELVRSCLRNLGISHDAGSVAPIAPMRQPAPSFRPRCSRVPDRKPTVGGSPMAGTTCNRS